MRRTVGIVVRILLGIMAVLFIVFGILGIRDHLWHLLVAGILILFLSIFWNFFKSPSKDGTVSPLWKKIRMAAVGILFIFALLDVALMIIGFKVAQPDASSDNKVTMVILGTDTKGDQPGDLLKLRLDKAIEYLQDSPAMKVIVTGKGRGEYSEAEVMTKYLVAHGIDSNRILQEDRAQSTLENFQFSKEIAKRENLPERFLVITNNYHQFRASLYAKEYGIETESLSAPTTWYMLFPLSERERFLIVTEWMGLSPDLINKYQEI